jgi:hypothetical protein
MSTDIRIGSHTIRRDRPDCFVIAEVGHNHGGDVEVCRQLFQAAKNAGVSAVKLQKRDNRALYTRQFYDLTYNSESAFGPTYGTHREALEFGESEYRDLKQFAESLDLVFFATAFDFPSVEFLERIDVPCYKVASGDLTHIPLIKAIAQTGKPMILSTGAGTLDDVKRAYDAIMPLNFLWLAFAGVVGKRLEAQRWRPRAVPVAVAILLILTVLGNMRQFFGAAVQSRHLRATELAELRLIESLRDEPGLALDVVPDSAHLMPVTARQSFVAIDPVWQAHPRLGLGNRGRRCGGRVRATAPPGLTGARLLCSRKSQPA